MKGILRNTIYYSIGFFVLSSFFSGIVFENGIYSILIAGFVITLLTTFVKPVLSLITFPINALTLGFFTYLIDALMLYVLTLISPGITITGFRFEGVNFLGFVVPQFYVNSFFAYVLSALVLFFVKKLLEWIAK